MTFSDRTKDSINAISPCRNNLFLLVIWLSFGFVVCLGRSVKIANPGGIGALYLIKAMIPLGFALLFLQSLAQAIQAFLRFRARQ